MPRCSSCFDPRDILHLKASVGMHHCVVSIRDLPNKFPPQFPRANLGSTLFPPCPTSRPLPLDLESPCPLAPTIELVKHRSKRSTYHITRLRPQSDPERADGVEDTCSIQPLPRNPTPLPPLTTEMPTLSQTTMLPRARPRPPTPMLGITSARSITSGTKIELGRTRPAHSPSCEKRA